MKRFNAGVGMRGHFAIRALLLSLFLPAPLLAGTSNWIGGLSQSFVNPGNWDAGVPTDDAGFNTVQAPRIVISGAASLNSLTFNPGASAYTLEVQLAGLTLSGAGILNNSANTQSIICNTANFVRFANSASAGSATLIRNIGGRIEFFNITTAGNSTIVNDQTGILAFFDSSSGGNSMITNNSGSTIQMNNNSTLFAATVDNNGSIDATNKGGGLWSVGSLSGSGTLNLGDTTLNVGNNNLSTTFAGTISGSGFLNKSGLGTWTLTGANTYTGGTTIGAGTLNVLGSLVSPVLVVSPGILSGTGSIGDLTNNGGTVTPGVSGIGTLTASSYSGAGALNVGLDGSFHGALRITGGADITGGTLNLTGTQIGVGRYSVLNARSLTGTFSTVTSPASTVLTFTPEYTLTDAFAVINFATPFTPYAQDTNQSHVAANLNGPKDSSTADFTNNIISVSQLPAGQIPGVLTQLSGDSLASFQTVNLQNAAVFIQGMRQRAVNVSSGTNGLWAQGIGYVDSVDGDSSLGSPAYNTTTGGFQAGYDELVTDDLLVGIAGSYAKTSLDVTDRNSSGNTSTIQTGIYAHATRDLWFLNGAFSYLTEINDMTRTIQYSTLNEQASSDFNSRLFSTLLEAGYSYHPRNALTLEPAMALRQTHLSQEGFTETGAPGLGLTVADQSLNSWVTSLGISMRRSFLESSEHPLDLNVSTAWEHELGNADNEISAHFAETAGGSDFTVSGTPRSRNAAVIKLESRVPLRTDFELFANYSASLSAVETMQKLMGGARYKW